MPGGDERHTTRLMGAGEATYTFDVPLWRVEDSILVLKGLTVRGTVRLSQRQVEMERELRQLREDDGSIAFRFAEQEDEVREIVCDLYEDEIRFSLFPPPIGENAFHLLRMRLLGALRIRDDIGTKYLEGDARRGGGSAAMFFFGLGRRIPEAAGRLLARILQ